MIEAAAPDIIEKIISYWFKKRGFTLAILLCWGLVAIIINYFDKDNKLAPCYFFSFLFTFFVILLIWLFTTYRIVLRNGHDLVLGVMILVDEETEAQNLYRISKNTILNIKDSNIFKNVKIIFFPTNFMFSIVEVKNYVVRNTNSYDIFLILHVKSGNVSNDHKVEIKKFEFICNLSNMPIEKSIVDEKIDFISEIKLQNFHKKWIILNSNSFEDRERIKTNFKDFLCHAIAIQYILIEKPEKALKILESILNLEKVKIQMNNDSLNIQPQGVSQIRILNLLVALYLAISDKHMYSNPKKTLKFLKELESLIPKHKYSFIQYIRMARMYYECEDLDNAILYTNKAKKIDNKEPAIYFNFVFFGILSQNWQLIHTNLKLIFHNRGKIDNGVVDIIAFLAQQKKRYPHLEMEFNFIINCYEALFLDQNLGKIHLKNLLPNLINKNVPETIIYLGNKIIETKK